MSRIPRRVFLTQAIGGTAIAAVQGGDKPSTNQRTNVPRPQRLNVLYVISDQHQAACMGHEGHTQAITPNMDRLAGQGVRFTKAYTQNPICTPSRMSILSGQYCHNHGYYGLNGPPPPFTLPSFLSHFRQNGYRTAAIGKVHTPDEPTNWLEGHCDILAECYRYFSSPPWLSDEYADYLRALGLLDKEDSVALPEFPGDQQHEGRPSHLPYEHGVEGWCVKKAIQFISNCQGQPFCVQVSLPRPHQCYTPDKRFWEMYPDDLALPKTLYQDDAHRPPHFRAMVKRLKDMKWLIEPKTFEAGCRRVWRGYLACITQVDHALGQLMDYLDQAGIVGSTIVLYGSDHGGYEGTFGVPEKAPGICSEAVCRVPLIWRVPKVTPAGAVCSQFVENLDIGPTIAALCGLPPMETADGIDLSGLLQGASKPVRDVAVTENPWSKGLRWGPWRFVHYQEEMFGKDTGELYNLENDPDETTNLYEAQAYRSVVQQCRRLLLEWLIRTSRIVTALPAPEGREFSQTAADGKESNKIGVTDRLRRGNVNYL
ncbi:MAG: sulfatase-like hydrolase/transferase [Acidobacteriota bacterium]